MKTTLYILTLFLLFQTGSGEDSTNINIENYSSTIYCLPDVEIIFQQPFNGYTASYMQSNNHHSISLGNKPIFYSQTLVQWNPVQFDWQTNDSYNNGNTSYSFLLPLSYLGYSGLYFIAEELFAEKSINDLSEWRKLIIAPILLSIISNSKYNHKIYSFNTSTNTYFFSSLFVKTKLDYFTGNSNTWWRWKPGFGIEIAELTGARTRGSFKNTYGISLELGLEKPIDFGVANPQSHKLTPYVNFILMKEF